MRKAFVSITIAFLLLAVITGVGLAAFMSPVAKGAYITTSSTINSEKIRSAGFNTIVDLSSTVIYKQHGHLAGPLNGISTVQGTWVIHPDGSADFHGVEVFTGTVHGVPGTVTFKLTGGSSAVGAVKLTAVIVGGTGELANVRGVLWKFGRMDEDGPVGLYTGRLLLGIP